MRRVVLVALVVLTACGDAGGRTAPDTSTTCVTAPATTAPGVRGGGEVVCGPAGRGPEGTAPATTTPGERPDGY